MFLLGGGGTGGTRPHLNTGCPESMRVDTITIIHRFNCTVESVYSGHCVRLPPPYYSHLHVQIVQAPSGKIPYIEQNWELWAWG